MKRCVQVASVSMAVVLVVGAAYYLPEAPAGAMAVYQSPDVFGRLVMWLFYPALLITSTHMLHRLTRADESDLGITDPWTFCAICMLIYAPISLVWIGMRAALPQLHLESESADPLLLGLRWLPGRAWAFVFSLAIGQANFYLSVCRRYAHMTIAIAGTATYVSMVIWVAVSQCTRDAPVAILISSAATLLAMWGIAVLIVRARKNRKPQLVPTLGERKA